MINEIMFPVEVDSLCLFCMDSKTKISDATEHAPSVKDEATTPLEDNWISLASAIEEQHEVFAESIRHEESS